MQKEGRKKQARSYKQQSKATQHTACTVHKQIHIRTSKLTRIHRIQCSTKKELKKEFVINLRMYILPWF